MLIKRIVLMGCLFALHSGAAVLESGSVSLSVDTAGVRLLPAKDGNNAYRNPTPLELQILKKDGTTRWFRAGYERVQRDGNAMICRGKIETPGGSLFSFRDVYESDAAGGAIRLSREVDVVKTGTEQGFLSRFALRSSSDFGDHEYFVPAIWYGDNSKARPGALGTQHSDDFFIFREDRMPLPVVMMRNRATGTAITLVHLEPDGSTCPEDFAAARVVDARIQVASLGIFGQQKTGLALYYPAAEGERSYARTPKLKGNPRKAKRWVDRFHPVQPGVSHRYSVLIGVGESDGFPQAMKNAWRMAYDRIHPPLADTDIEASYEASMQLVANQFKTVNGAPGLPFKLGLPGGTLSSPSIYTYQMGFVGQQIPLAYHLLYYGLTKNNSEMVAKGEAMMDFWSENSLTDDGLPRTWYNTMPKPRWRNYDTYMRVVSDGMGGALKAWDVMKQHGKNRPEWLRYCTAFGDWLVRNQNEDGSWYRSYAWDGSVVESGKSNTSNPIRFLVDLHAATGHERYLNAALKAGKYCWDTTHKQFDYVGGAADNPNVLDKEAGFMAMDAFLALWDATGHEKCIEAAAQAADFTETWAYSWKVPLMEDAERIFPSWVPTTGFSIIATGHSGADIFLAGAPYLYYRIYLLTGDEHYADMARQLLYDPRMSIDVDGSLGYAEPGLCTEALSLTVDGKRGRGNGVDVWLPWVTYSMVEPLVRLQEAYGMMDTPNNLTAEQFQRAREMDKAKK